MTTNYRDLLAELGSSAFTELRPAQDQVLAAYAAEFDAKTDLAIELPTGAGKSLIALLIAESWRRQGRTAAILTANKTLAHQMEHEATALGLPVVRLEGSASQILVRDKRRFHRGQAIAIMNYWVYFNQNPAVDAANLLILDDAHLAEHCLHSLYSVEIERSRHRSLFDSLITELSQQFPEYSVLQDALEESASPIAATQLLSFLDQSGASRRLREIVDSSPSLEADTDLRFRWWRMRDKLDGANVYLARDSIWIRPYVYPLSANSHYAAATQVIYMSATIGDPADVSRRLGTRRIDRVAVDHSLVSTTYGRRLIIMDGSDDTNQSERFAAVLKTALAVQPKSLWLCSRRSEAERLKEQVSDWLNRNGFIGHPVWMLIPNLRDLAV